MHMYMFTYIHTYNRNRINKTTIFYTTLSFMFPEFSSIYIYE